MSLWCLLFLATGILFPKLKTRLNEGQMNCTSLLQKFYLPDLFCKGIIFLRKSHRKRQFVFTLVMYLLCFFKKIHLKYNLSKTQLWFVLHTWCAVQLKCLSFSKFMCKPAWGITQIPQEDLRGKESEGEGASLWNCEVTDLLLILLWDPGTLSVLGVPTNFKGRLVITETGGNNGTRMKLALCELDCKGRNGTSFT